MLALDSMQLSDVVIGLKDTSIYGDGLVYSLWEDVVLTLLLTKEPCPESKAGSLHRRLVLELEFNCGTARVKTTTAAH